jgi:DNA mismatch repair protein MutS
MTPMQQQYKEIKELHPDAILLFRLGDFFEAFNQDAEQISEVLGITLTGRGKGEKRTPMAGIPHHALPTYLPKLVKAGLKVAIADQVEEAVSGKLVDRKVTQIITSGTVIDERSLDYSSNNFIAAVFKDKKERFYMSYADITTGTFFVFKTKFESILINELTKISPAEILISIKQEELQKLLNEQAVEMIEDKNFNHEDNFKLLCEQFKVRTLKGFGIDDDSPAINTSGALIQYMRYTQKKPFSHMTQIKVYDHSEVMQLDRYTISNLELLYPLQNNNDLTTTVYSNLNSCRTAMGQRLLKNILLHPLTNEQSLQERLDSVEFFYKEPILTDDVRESLSNIKDIERICGRIGLGTANPKDLRALYESFENVFILLQNLSGKDLPLRLKYLVNIESLSKLQELAELIDNTIDEDPSNNISEGGYIKDGFNKDVDHYRSLKRDSQKILMDIQQREVQRTGISSLKVAYNKVFGYYIEITKTHSDKVPVDYVRKQTLVNAERYITEELKKVEDELLNADDSLIIREKELFNILIEEISQNIKIILECAERIAEIDILAAFGFNARNKKYVKPEISKTESLAINKGRHIVVENKNSKFIPNNTKFSSDKFVHILTGPNMSGKSTYIRQVALLVLLAHIGSFVPAESMSFSIVDRIFTRVGASDNLAKGESTFMVEMIETANILRNATDKSLLILDEVGRGTSTYDGVAIAWAIVEYILDKIKAKTLFATHYHELVQLEKSNKNVENYNVAVDDDKGKITFQYQIKKGGTNKSYGVHVAKIAGLPDEVISKASRILEDFEESNKNNKNKPKDKKSIRPKSIAPEQLGLI